MQLLVKLYDKAIQWSKHKHAPRYLAAVSFLDASVLPLSPYFMFTPMAIARPNRAYNYALITTLATVFGGILGYVLGYFAFKPLVLPLLQSLDYMVMYEKVLHLLQKYGFWAVLVAGFTPIPFKFVSIAAGFMQIAILPFILAAILGRGVKFFLLATIIRLGGSRVEDAIRMVLNKSGVFLLGLLSVLVGCKVFGVI